MDSPSRVLIMERDPKSPVSEAFRTLRTNLQFVRLDSPLRSLVITSTAPGEGKSTVAANLAIAMAQAGKSTILVDADLRRPKLHKMFNVPNRVGLTNLLLGNAGLEALQETKAEGVRLLPSGVLPPNPSELLASGAMTRVIEVLDAEADMVIFDTPPMMAVTDAAVLGTKVDGVLLVLKLGQVAREGVMRAKTLLQNANARILGVVANGIKPEGRYNYYYYYYYEE
ncbi:MAG TPA: CpsD/CapB family tyrosine-protein kinase [Firmicutes bacterium]|nr:CpsD/CapB family tyrosine-protein kinase [Bacillota bacterium]